MRYLFLSACAVVVAACSGNNSSTTSSSSNGVFPAECPQPSGSYQAKYVKLGGTCNDLGTRIVVLDETLDEGCTTSYQPATREGDGCKLEAKASCTSAEGTATITLVAQIPGDKKEIKGKYTIDAQGNGGSCTGTYDVTYTKL